MPGFKVANVDRFGGCWYGRTEWRFVIELGQLYFYVAIDVALDMCWDVGTGVMEGDLFNLSLVYYLI